MTRQALKELNTRPIAYYPIYRKITGSTTAGILLSQLMYWLSKKDKIYKTDNEIIDETCLTKDELKGAKKLIKKLDFITVSLEGLPAKTYYEIDWELYQHTLQNDPNLVGGNSTNTDVEIPPTGEGKSPKHYSIIKNTETTTETTHNNNSDDDFFEDSNLNNDADFNRAFNEFALGNKFKGNKKDAYKAYKNITINKSLLLIAIYRFLRDADIEKRVGFKKFIDDSVYLSYLPKMLEITKGSAIYSGEYNLETFEFVNFSGVNLGIITPEKMLEEYKQKNIKFLKLDKKAA